MSMSVTTPKTYTVEASEVLQRTYIVTTPGDESRAAQLAQEGDYGTPTSEAVELLDEFVVDFSIARVEWKETPAA